MKKDMMKMPTLLQAVERVVELSRDSKLSDEFMKEALLEVGFLAGSFGITERQAVLFCVCMEKGPRRVDFDDLANFLDVNNIRILSYASDIDALVHRRLLRYRDANDEDQFDVPIPVIKALKHNEVYQLPQRTGLDCAGLFEQLDMWFGDLDDDAISLKELKEETESLLKDNPQVLFVKQLKEYYLDSDDQLLLLLFCHLLVNKDDDDIRFGQMENLFDSKADFNNVKAKLRNGDHKLMKKMLIEHRCEDGIADTTRYKLTESTKRTLLAELKITAREEKLADVLKPESLMPKELFFSDNIQHQVSELRTFFLPEQYKKIHERMGQSGFRQGFACLFYGSPGTGKTETVYQLARQTGRSLMVVDVPQIKSKWVGDSEKNIKALFERYRELVKKSEIAPILLFNEADGIIGIRKQGASSAVDKMENTVQNIIRQEMETLDGIMIATTNLTENLDIAFERRFLYKIRFEKPDVSVRCKIWQQMIPELNEVDATTLANNFDFSGGQIENVARKFSINTILHGQASELLPLLNSYCQEERLQGSCTRKIGF